MVNISLIVTSNIPLEFDRDCPADVGFYLQAPDLLNPKPISVQIAQLSPGKAVDKVFSGFREVIASGQGILLIAILAWMVWMAWKKRMN